MATLKGDKLNAVASAVSTDSPAAIPKSSSEMPVLGGESEYCSIPLNLYVIGTPITFDLYFYYQRQYVLFRSKGSQWTAEDSQKVKSGGFQGLFGKFKTTKDHHDYLHSKMKEILSQPNVATDRKAKVLAEVSAPILEGLFKSHDSSEMIASAAELAQSCMVYVSERGSLPELFKAASDSLSEHAHALFTSAYSIALGRKMGVQDQAQTFALGLGGLLHDIGKVKIDHQILEKPDELDDQEWLIVRQHPEMGEQILYHRQAVPALTRRIVLEHHERFNGRGYPRGIRNIHTFSKIVSVVDCFNSLTRNRPWAPAMPPYEALKFMLNQMRSEFDPEVMQQFISMLSR
jgi:HD-GYP domain-containing protein (c-di-GMP phosphodiesterase class II)